MIPVTVAVERREHDAERTSPLTEEDEEVMPQALLWKQEAPVVHWEWMETTHRLCDRWIDGSVNNNNKKKKITKPHQQYMFKKKVFPPVSDYLAHTG